ncbi:hypothetical protein NPIL_26191 [Nephila pilipes]|uniref:Uncharacterized protein n=1 Tax=Nephila pilipes TaxID=299642 RepID=A0A8X6QUS6_NEPPI|nr:hypothetical protein NPIL_26191 [Nephila pilipes]
MSAWLKVKLGFGGRTVPYEPLREEPGLKDETKMETVVHRSCKSKSSFSLIYATYNVLFYSSSVTTVSFKVRLERDFDPIVCSVTKQQSLQDEPWTATSDSSPPSHSPAF